MMADLINGEFELQGMTFGTSRSGYPLLPGGFSVGSAEFRTQDGANPIGDGRAFGRDYLEGVTYSWELLALEDGVDRWRAVSRLASEFRSNWHGGAARRTPRMVDEIRVWHGDKVGRIYGRARHYAEDRTRLRQGVLKITCDFAAADDLVYDDELSQFTSVLTGASLGGLTAPLVAPLVGHGNSSTQGGYFTVEGDANTPVMLRFSGPVTYPRITIDGLWVAGLDMPLAYGEYVDVDARVWARSVLKNGSVSVAGKLSRATPSLEELVLSPGVHQMVFTGIDATNSARASLSWRNARHSV